jgi:hypothetical protein
LEAFLSVERFSEHKDVSRDRSRKWYDLTLDSRPIDGQEGVNSAALGKFLPLIGYRD